MAHTPQPLDKQHVLKELKDKGITNLEDLAQKIVAKKAANPPGQGHATPDLIWWGHNYSVWVRPD